MVGISSVFEVASRVSTPLALSGLMMAVLFFIFRQLIDKDIFPKLTEAVGGPLLKQIVDRLFVLALVAMILGAIGYCLPLVYSGAPKQSLPLSKNAENFLDLLYANKYQAAYDSLAPALKDNLTYIAFAENAKKNMAQFAGPPQYRHPRNSQIIAGLCYLSFDAEFDERSHYRELLAYAENGNGWMLIRYEIDPASWPISGLAKLCNQASPDSLFAAVRKLSTPARNVFISNELVGHWIPVSGWTSRVQKVLSKKAARTCDVLFHDSTSNASLVARDVLDGCALQSETEVTLLGEIETVSERSLELSSVRLLF